MSPGLQTQFTPSSREAQFLGAQHQMAADGTGPPTFLDGGQASALERERFGKSVSSYATQLKSWVDMQVDARLKIVLHDVESEVLASRQESRAALDSLAQMERLMLTADDSTRRETAEVQQETLATVSDLMRTVDELKRASDQDHREEIMEMRRLHAEHEAAFGEIQRLQADHRKEIELLMDTRQEVRDFEGWVADNEQKLANWRAELVQDLGAEIQLVDAAWKDQALQKHELSGVARQADLEDMQCLFEKANRRLGDDLLAHQQRLISELRSETNMAFKSEAASVTALDEQMWLTDQRLGQRIDKVDQQTRECTASAENLLRTHNEFRRSHQESMTRIKGLAQSHREHNRSRSPETASKVMNLTERPLRSPEGFGSSRLLDGGASVNEEAAAEPVLRSPRSFQGLDEQETARYGGARSVDDRHHASASESRASSRGLAMARLAGKTFDDLAHNSRSYSSRGILSARGSGSGVAAAAAAGGSGIAMARSAGDAFADIAHIPEAREPLRDHRPPLRR